METKKVWLVTGASKGLGLTLVKKLLDAGYKVAATSRDINALRSEVSHSGSEFLPLQMDVVDEQSVAKSINRIVDTFGMIDVVVNNAGYGQIGTLEELSDKEARQNFDINVFGSLNVIRHVMPYFRKQHAGTIFNISSIAGFLGTFPGWGIYNATKFAVAGFTEALSAEAKSLGVSAVVVYPGYFKTNFLLKGSMRLAQNPIAEYKEARDLEVIHEEQVIGNQPGDPEKAATVFIEVAEMETKPLHLFLGSDSYKMARDKMATIENEMTTYESLGLSTDFGN
ncbi:MAG: SDR family oxidoreductase [Olivibacter sp.]|nr:SDR family oxidoreductase [Olivibacter sp. UJ_SKK_5.1]